MKQKFYILLIFFSVTFIMTSCSRASASKDSHIQPVTSTIPSETGTADAGTIEETSSSNALQVTEQDIMKQFDTLSSDANANLKDILLFMKEAMVQVSQENASAMVLHFEDMQKAKLQPFEEKFYPESMVKAFQEADLAGYDYNDPLSFKEANVQELVKDAIAMGYKIDSAEGFYFPVIDYSIYQNFSNYVTEDLKDYISIMTIETDQVFAKDAALMITWDEVIRRTLVTEEFLTKYKDSKRATAIKELFDRYEFIALNGVDNTLLFDYDTKLMREGAKTAYQEIISENKTSGFIDILKGFMEVVEKNQFKLTEEVEQYRQTFSGM